MATTADFRNGMVIVLDGTLYTIIEFQHVKPGKGGAFVRTKLKGVVSLGNLVRHVLFLYHDQPVDGRSLVRMAISEKATDFIEHEPVCVRVSDDVEDVLARMIRRNIKEIAVVDEQNRVVGDVTMVDLLGYYQCYKDAAESD